MTLIVTYARRLMKLPACSIIKASLEKVEKVVNPPQIPTVMKSAHELFSLALLLKNPHIPFHCFHRVLRLYIFSDDTQL